MKASGGRFLPSLRGSGITVASNNGDIGGGEIMLLAMAAAMTELGVAVTIVGPESPKRFVDAANERGFKTIALPAGNRVGYMRALRKWDRHREGVLWCNGLLPAVATSGHRSRVVHLHQRPRGKQRLLAQIARQGSVGTVVPSADMAAAIPGSWVLHNWVSDMGWGNAITQPGDMSTPIRLGFLGRLSTDKGIKVLADSVKLLDRESPGRYRLVLAGESRFVDKASRDAVESALDSLGGIVERAGWISADDFFSGVDLLICPSISPESFGLVVAEAMSARIPVVVSDAGALPEVVGPEHPWIARAGDSVDLARVVRQAAHGDPTAVERAFQRWLSLFSPEAGRRRLGVLLDDLGVPPSRKKKAGL